MIRTLTLAGLLSLGLATAALADPCKAIPDRGPMPGYLHSGARFSGPIVYIGDGDSLCVGVGSKPDAWVEVRLADFYAPELREPGGPATKAALVRIAMGQRAECVADHQSHDRVVARCEIAGRSLGDLMRAEGVQEGGRAYRAASNEDVSAAPIIVTSSGRHASVATGATYRNCAAARAAGVAPMYRGDPGYSPHLDGDGDGIACEPYRRR